MESQIESAHSDRAADRKTQGGSESADVRRKRDSLLLARTRVLDQIQSASDDRYREMMQRALADLDRILEQTH